MRLARFGDNRLGLVNEAGGDTVLDVSPALDVLPALRYPVPPGDLLIANLDAVLARARELAPGASARARASTASRLEMRRSPGGRG